MSSALEWTQVQRDLAHLIEPLYSILIFAVNSQTDVGRVEFRWKLAEMPEGWRVAQFLRDIDSRWGDEPKAPATAC
jgi:hypothetical protein